MLQQFQSEPQNNPQNAEQNKNPDMWNQLINIQARQMSEYEQKLSEQERLRRQKYREDLQYSLDHKNNKKEIEREEEKRLHQIQLERYSGQDNQRLQKEQQLKLLNEQCLNNNKSQIMQKEQQHMKEKEEDFKYAQDNLKMAQLSLEQQKYMEYEKKNMAIQDLNSAFQNQQDYKSQVKQHEKQTDQQYAFSEKELLELQEQKRKQFMNKIKGGYHQNEQIIDYYSQLHNDHVKKEQDFYRNNIEKVREERAKLAYDEEMRRINQKNYLSKQNHDILEQQINQKEQAKLYQQQQQQQLYQEMQNNLKIAQNKEMEKQQMQMQQKQQYINELKNQIDQNRDRRLNQKSMNDFELGINQGQLQQTNSNTSYVPIVPGLAPTQDYSRRKQNQYIEKTLGHQDGNGNSDKKRGNSLHHVAANALNNNAAGQRYQKPASRDYSSNNNIFNIENPEVQQMQSQRQQIENKLSTLNGNQNDNQRSSKGQFEVPQSQTIDLHENHYKKPQSPYQQQYSNAQANIGRGPSNKFQNSSNLILGGGSPTKPIHNNEMLEREAEKKRQLELIQQATRQHQVVGRNPSNALYASSGAMPVGNHNYQPSSYQQQKYPDSHYQQQQQKLDPQVQQPYQPSPQEQFKQDQYLPVSQTKEQYQKYNNEQYQGANIGRNPSNKFQHTEKNVLNGGGDERKFNDPRAEEKKKQEELLKQFHMQNQMSNIGRGPSNKMQFSAAHGSVF